MTVETTPDVQRLVVGRPVPAANARVGAIFRRTLQDNRNGIIAWGSIYSALIILVVVLYPSLEANGALMNILGGLGLMESLALGAGGMSGLGRFSSYLALELMTWAPLVFAVYLIPQGMAAIAREEERGTLDILLSTPIPRWRLLTEKTLGIIASLLSILLMMWLSLVISVNLMPEVELETSKALASIWHVVPISLVILTSTLFLSVTMRSSRTAAGLAALFVIGSYFTRSLADLTRADVMMFAKQFSFFTYYRSLIVLTEGFQWPQDILLLTISLIFFLLALRNFQRRDLGV